MQKNEQAIREVVKKDPKPTIFITIPSTPSLEIEKTDKKKHPIAEDYLVQVGNQQYLFNPKTELFYIDYQHQPSMDVQLEIHSKMVEKGESIDGLYKELLYRQAYKIDYTSTTLGVKTIHDLAKRVVGIIKKHNI